MLINIHTITGKVLSLEVSESDSIRQVKEMIESKEGLDPDSVHIVKSTQRDPLQDNQSIADAGVDENTTLNLIFRLR